MRIDLGAKVRTKDGHRAGHVKQAIWDPTANQIIGYVINTGGLLGHEVVLSPEMIEEARRDGDEIVLSLNKNELDEIARYEESDYSAPPADWIAPAVYAFPSAGYVWPLGYADAPPLAPPRAPTLHVHEPEIKRGMRVRDANGDEIGVVEEVKVDESTEELRGIVVRRGGLLERVAGKAETVEIDAEQIGQIDDDELRLVTSGAEIFGRQRA
jgi:sporulation protein YlmC with PRC-barrel domain